MHRLPTITTKEKIILVVFFLSGIGVLGLYLLLGLFQTGFPGLGGEPDHAEIALILPQPPNQSATQVDLLNGLSAVMQNLPDFDAQAVEIVAYTPPNTPDAIAKAAWLAARKPATVAIIGPLDARPALAAAETVRGADLVVVTTASTTPILPLSQFPNLYRLPAPDNLQGQAMVTFLAETLARKEVFLVAEASAYVQHTLDNFNHHAQERLKIVGTVDLSGQDLPEDFATQLADSAANAVVYLGSREKVGPLLAVLADPDIDIPLVMGDALNDPALAAQVAAGTEVYYASPLLSLGGFTDEKWAEAYQQVLGTGQNTPFMYETLQAVGSVFQALEYHRGDQTYRQAVWENLGRTQMAGPRGESYAFRNRQWLPLRLYVYQIDPAAEVWGHNPVAAVIPGR